jgi:acetolactate synthase-1/3 small subunit
MNAFVELLEDFNITEIARTGITGLARGSADMNKM